jgi:SAM-dependent methyltransferase
MPLRTNALERLVLGRLNRQPVLMLDYFSALGFRVTIAAIRLGVFDALDGGPATAAELSSRLGTDARGTSSLLDVLASLGYVRRRGDRYENTPTASRWMTRGADQEFVDATQFLEMNAFEIWGDLEQTVRSGRPARPFYERLEADPDLSDAFQTWTRWTARETSSELARRVPLPPTASRLIDIGGSHGRYAAAFCRTHPGLSAVVFDFPTALRAAEDLLREPDLEGRLRLQPGDFLADDLGTEYDVALLLNVVHGLGEADNRELIGRVARALNPGGTLVIMEQFTGRAPGPAVEAINRLLDLNYHLALGGRTYGFAEVAGWLTDAGFDPPKRINFRSTPGLGGAVAVRPGG